MFNCIARNVAYASYVAFSQSMEELQLELNYKLIELKLFSVTIL